jgi:predicted nucleic acid-binding protein
VVEQVWTEITQHAPQALADPRLEREPVVEIDPVLQAKFSLQSGATAAIAFALKQHPASLLLTDDAAARRACASVGLAAVGTIGLILEAARSKRVPVAEALQALEQLPNKGRLHVAPELLARAIAALWTAT